MKCAIVYLSMTGNTEMIARGIASGIRAAAGSCELIRYRDASPYELGGYDLIGFGMPVMGYSVPAEFKKFFKCIRYIGGKHGFAFATHGTHGEYFPGQAYDMLTEKQMTVLGVRRWYANSYIPGHPHPYFTAGHPDKIDVEEAKQWGRELVNISLRASSGDSGAIPPPPTPPELSIEEMLGNLHRVEDERSGGTFGSNTPHVQSPSEKYNRETCNYPRCSICADNCPTHGIDLSVDPPVMGDPCFHCMICAKLCPTGSLSPEFFYTTPGEKTVKYVPEFYLEQLEDDETSGFFRRKVALDEIGWTTPYYMEYDRHPWFVPGKGPNGPRSRYWGEGMAELEGEIDYD